MDGFGLHGLVHLAQAAAVRDYTSGSVTPLLIVIPYAVWARGRLRRAGRLRPADVRGAVSGAAMAGAATALSHFVARRLVRRLAGAWPGAGYARQSAARTAATRLVVTASTPARLRRRAARGVSVVQAANR